MPSTNEQHCTEPRILDNQYQKFLKAAIFREYVRILWFYAFRALCAGREYIGSGLLTVEHTSTLKRMFELAQGTRAFKSFMQILNLPQKKTKKHTLTKEERKNNKRLTSQRVLNENVIGVLKRFKIIVDRYRNRRKRFSLRFNLIAAIYNFGLIK